MQHGNINRILIQNTVCIQNTYELMFRMLYSDIQCFSFAPFSNLQLPHRGIGRMKQYFYFSYLHIFRHRGNTILKNDNFAGHFDTLQIRIGIAITQSSLLQYRVNRAVRYSIRRKRDQKAYSVIFYSNFSF